MTYWQQVAAAAHVMSSDGGSSGGGELCVLLDGVDNRIDLGSQIVLPVGGADEWAVTFRAMMLDDGGNMLFGTHNDSENRFYFTAGGNNHIRTNLNNGEHFDFLFDPTVNQNTWLDGRLSYSGGFALSINNVDVEYAERTWTGSVTDLRIDNIGLPYINNSFSWHGYVSHFRVDLNGQTVLDLPFNEGSGTTHYDTSPSGNNGTAVNTGAGYWVRV